MEVLDIMDINSFLQAELRRRNIDIVTAVEAASWLDEAGLLRDSEQKHGKPLRQLLRNGKIVGSVQDPPRPHGRWYIKRLP